MKIVRTKPYERSLKRLGAAPGEIAALEQAVVVNPTAGAVVPGLGVRKIRFSLGGRGKRGGGRAIYYAFLSEETVIMLLAYSKADQSDLTGEQRAAIARMLKELE